MHVEAKVKKRAAEGGARRTWETGTPQRCVGNCESIWTEAETWLNVRRNSAAYHKMFCAPAHHKMGQRW